MKIGILWENFEFGGVTSHLQNFLNNKTFKKDKFIIFTNKNNKAIPFLKKKIKSANIKFEYYNSINVLFFDNYILKISFFILRPIFFVISIIQFYFLIKKFKFDILLGNCGGYGDFRSELAGILASSFLNLPKKILLIHHSYTKPFLWNFLLRKIDLVVKKNINGLIFVSKATRRNIYENTSLYSKKIREKVIYNGINIAYTKQKDKKMNKLFKGNGRLKIGMLSRIEPYKGHENLVNVINELPIKFKRKLMVYFIGLGQPKYLDELKIKIKKFDLNSYFKFTGYINEDSPIILKRLDLLLSLTKDFEGFGLSVAESFLANTPVLATKVGGITEFLNDKNSILIKPNNQKELKLSLIKFVKNPIKYKKKSMAGKKIIYDKFNSEKMAQNFKIFFDEC